MAVDREIVAQVLAEVGQGRTGGIAMRDDGSVGLVLEVDGLDRRKAAALQLAVETAVRKVPGVTAVRIIQTAEKGNAPAEPKAMTIVAVASGKGGVGKSTVSANLAVALARLGKRVALLDADIYGPSVPTLLGHSGRATVDAAGALQPIEAHGVKALSMGMMTDPDKAIVWRGPMASRAMQQLIEKADWGDTELMIVDMPPGTGDIQLTLAQQVKPAGAIVVSTPQDLALIDARRAIAMFLDTNVPVLGLVENMSVFVCPHCGGASHPFGHGGAEAEAAKLGVPFLGALPLDIRVREASDAGQPPAAGDGPEAEAFRALAEQVMQALRL